MILVLSLVAFLWGLGHLMGAPRMARMYMIGLLFVAVLAVHFIFPDGHPLREATGKDPAFWLLIAGLVVIVLLYREALGWLRGKAEAKEEAEKPTSPKGQFATGELERYARHIVLRELGGPGQKALKEASVLVIGAGGLGAPALQYLAAAGVGTIGVVDNDVVDSGNLQRQVIHRDKHIGMPKVFSAEIAMKELNPYIDVRPYNRRLDDETANKLFGEYDVILDGTDNFETRYLVNRVAVATDVPLVSGALSQWEGQLSVFHPASGGPCYQCIFPKAPAPELAPSCAEAGVVGPLPGVIGSMMAVETIKCIADTGQGLRGEMLIYDALWGETRKISLKARSDCVCCGGRGLV